MTIKTCKSCHHCEHMQQKNVNWCAEHNIDISRRHYQVCNDYQREPGADEPEEIYELRGLFGESDIIKDCLTRIRFNEESG